MLITASLRSVRAGMEEKLQTPTGGNCFQRISLIAAKIRHFHCAYQRAAFRGEVMSAVLTWVR
jgi:hypothetical protein